MDKRMQPQRDSRISGINHVYLSFCWQELSPASLVFRQKHVEELISGVGIRPEYGAVKHAGVSPGLAMFGLSTWLSSLAAEIL